MRPTPAACVVLVILGMIIVIVLTFAPSAYNKTPKGLPVTISSTDRWELVTKFKVEDIHENSMNAYVWRDTQTGIKYVGVLGDNTFGITRLWDKDD